MPLAIARSAARVVALEGPSGAGKTTVHREIVGSGGVIGLGEAYDRPPVPPTLTYRNRSELLTIELTLLGLERERYREAREIRAQGGTVFLDTGFLGPLSYAWALRELRGSRSDVVEALLHEFRTALKNSDWGLSDLTIYLDVPGSVSLGRASRSPERHPPRLRRRHAAVAEWERHLWLGPIARALPGRVRAVSGLGSVAQVAARVLGAVRRAPPAPPVTPEESGRVLDLLEERPPGRTAELRAATVKRRARSPRLLRR